MKKRFLEELKRLLAPLQENERQEILDFYEERFNTGLLYEGKTESQIVDELERPEDIARNVLKEYGLRFTPHGDQKTNTNKPVSPWRILWLLLFDFFIVIWLVPLLFSILMGVGSGLLGFLFSYGFSLDFTAGSLFSLLFLIGVGFLWLILLLWVYDIFVSFIIWLVRWHCDVLNIPNRKRLLRTLNRFKAESFIKGRPSLHNFKTQFKGIAVVLLVVGAMGMLFTQGSLGLSANQELELHERSHTPTTLTSWEIITQLDIGDVKVEYYDGDDILVEMSVYDNVDAQIEINDDNQQIIVENTTNLRIFFSIDWFRNIFSDPNQTIIYLPNTLDIDHMDLTSKNGSVTLQDFSMETLLISTLNGTITLENLTVTEKIDAESSNGRITLRNVISPDIRTITSNGQIRLFDIDSSDIHLRTSNGNVVVRNANINNQDGATLYARTSNGSIEFEEVYYLEVEMRTSNGNISYHNTDLSFILDVLSTQTSNGSIDKNVPSR